MNRKNLILMLLLSLLLMGVAGIRLTAQTAHASNRVSLEDPDHAVELTWSFEVRIRLPYFKKDST